MTVRCSVCGFLLVHGIDGSGPNHTDGLVRESLSPPQVNVIHHKPITVDKSNHTVASGSNVTVNVATDHTSW